MSDRTCSLPKDDEEPVHALVSSTGELSGTTGFLECVPEQMLSMEPESDGTPRFSPELAGAQDRYHPDRQSSNENLSR